MTMLTSTQALNVAAATQARMGALPGNWRSKIGWNGSASIDADRLIDGLAGIYRR